MSHSSPAATPLPELTVLTDDVLLQRFLEQREEAAFTVLLRRHGPMVRATCKRCLGDTPELDDAFQVVFLVLARKGGSIRHRKLLGPWLHMVALRTARKLRSQRQRQAQRECVLSVLPEPKPVAPPELLDWLPVLDEELHRLPEKFSHPLVLCELQGCSRAEAATLLGLPEGTLSSRLARGRDLLRERLLRRGVTASAVALTTALTAEAGTPVPPSLLTDTIQAATTEAPNATVAALTQGVLRAMFLAKCKSAFVIAIAATIAVGGLLLSSTFARTGDKGAKSDKDLLQGEWRIVSAEIDGKPADEEELKQMQAKPMIFKGDKLISKVESDYVLDTTTKPKQIDIVPLDGPEQEKGKTFRGIYRLEGDQLTICFGAVPDGTRPANFKPQAGDLVGKMVLKRVKAGK